MSAAVGNGRGSSALTATSTTLAYSSNLTSGSSLGAFIVGNNNTITNMSVSDGTNGSYTAASVNPVTEGVALRAFAHYFDNNTSTATPTVTWSWTNSTSVHVGVCQITGVRTASAAHAANDQSNHSSTGTALTTASHTVSTDNAAVVAFFRTGGNATFTQSGSWAILSGTGLPTARGAIVSQVVTPSSVTPAVSIGVNDAWTGTSMHFYEPAATTTVMPRKSLLGVGL